MAVVFHVAGYVENDQVGVHTEDLLLQVLVETAHNGKHYEKGHDAHRNAAR
jgi:hypothetical protein